MSLDVVARHEDQERHGEEMGEGGGRDHLLPKEMDGRAEGYEERDVDPEGEVLEEHLRGAALPVLLRELGRNHGRECGVVELGEHHHQLIRSDVEPAQETGAKGRPCFLGVEGYRIQDFLLWRIGESVRRNLFGGGTRGLPISSTYPRFHVGSW